MSEEHVENMDECSKCKKKDTACVSFLSHENAMMHKDMDNERIHRNNLFNCLTIVVITLIFVIAYTIRMNTFVETINKLTAEIVELAGAKGIIAP